MPCVPALQENAEAVTFLSTCPVVIALAFIVYRTRYDLLNRPQLVHNAYMVRSRLWGVCFVGPRAGLRRVLLRCCFCLLLRLPKYCCVVGGRGAGGGQVELRARRLLSELERDHTATFTSSADAEQRAREDTEKMLLICAVRATSSRR